MSSPNWRTSPSLLVALVLCVSSCSSTPEGDALIPAEQPPVEAPLSTDAPSTTATSAAPTTTLDPQITDGDLIRSLTYEQQQLLQRGINRDIPTIDDFLTMLRFQIENTEPTFADRNYKMCSNIEEILQSYWNQLSTIDQRLSSLFDSEIVDLNTLRRDQSWTTDLFGETIGPFEGRTYVVTAEFQGLDGTIRKADVHFNIQNDRAYWFWGYEDEQCVAT